MTNRQSVKTALSVHPDWDISKQETYVYQYHLLKLPDLDENQLSVSGMKMDHFEDFTSVTAFIRSSLDKPIRLEMLKLLLLDENQQIVAKETFDMENFGELPAESARPWRFIFEKEAFDGELPKDGWSLAFEVKKNTEHVIEKNEHWTDEQNRQIQELLKNIPPVNPNELNIMGIKAHLSGNEELIVTLLIRNGSHKHIKIEKLPLIVEDASGDIAAKGVFSLTDFEVKANTSKPWSFVFLKDHIVKDSPDLSSWKVYPPN